MRSMWKLAIVRGKICESLLCWHNFLCWLKLEGIWFSFGLCGTECDVIAWEVKNSSVFGVVYRLQGECASQPWDFALSPFLWQQLLDVLFLQFGSANVKNMRVHVAVEEGAYPPLSCVLLKCCRNKRYTQQLLLFWHIFVWGGTWIHWSLQSLKCLTLPKSVQKIAEQQKICSLVTPFS